MPCSPSATRGLSATTDHGTAVASTRCSPTHQVVHNIAHAQLQDLNYGVLGVPVRQLHTFALLVELHTGRHRLGRGCETVRHRERSRRARRPTRSGTPAVRRAGSPISEPAPPARRSARTPRSRAPRVGAVSDVTRNVRHALGSEYLDSVYHHDHRPVAAGSREVAPSVAHRSRARSRRHGGRRHSRRRDDQVERSGGTRQATSRIPAEVDPPDGKAAQRRRHRHESERSEA